MPNASLFAYGTLRDSDVLGRVLGSPVATSRLRAAIAPDCQVVFFPGRTYPALRLARGSTASGTLIDGLSEADLVALDAFEGEEYRRGRIEIFVDGTPHEAAVYWPTIAIQTGIEWRFEDWLLKHKPLFLAAEAADSAAWRAQLTAMRDA